MQYKTKSEASDLHNHLNYKSMLLHCIEITINSPAFVRKSRSVLKNETRKYRKSHSVLNTE